MMTALNLSKEEDLTHILQDLDNNDMNDMESLEEIDKWCQNINFDEDICDGSQNKENKSPKKISPKKAEPVLLPFCSNEKKSPIKKSPRKCSVKPPLTHIPEPISDDELDMVNLS